MKIHSYFNKDGIRDNNEVLAKEIDKVVKNSVLVKAQTCVTLLQRKMLTKV